MPYRIPHRSLLVLLLVLPLAAAGCKVNEATGERQWNLLSTEQEIALGRGGPKPQFIEQNGGVIPAPEVRQYVSNLGRELAAKSEQPELPWEFHVLNTDVINAFALPGGKVFITRGPVVADEQRGRSWRACWGTRSGTSRPSTRTSG